MKNLALLLALAAAPVLAHTAQTIKDPNFQGTVTFTTDGVTTTLTSSSVTNQGNLVNVNSGLVKLDTSGNVPLPEWNLNGPGTGAAFSIIAGYGNSSSDIYAWCNSLDASANTGAAEIGLGRQANGSTTYSIRNWIFAMEPSVDSAVGTDALGIYWQGADRIRHLSASLSTGGTFTAPSLSGAGSGITGLNGSNVSTGTIAAARGGAGAVTGILKANGSGAVSSAVAGTDYMSPANVSAAYLPLAGGTTSGAITIGGSGPNFTLNDGTVAWNFLNDSGSSNTLKIGRPFAVDSFWITTDGSGHFWHDLQVDGALKITSGSNALSGTVSLSSGTGTITSSAIDTSTAIVFSNIAPSGTPGIYQPLARCSSGSAAVTSVATDNSTYVWIGFKKN